MNLCHVPANPNNLPIGRGGYIGRMASAGSTDVLIDFSGRLILRRPSGFIASSSSDKRSAGALSVP
jgi:hypothetical protein